MSKIFSILNFWYILPWIFEYSLSIIKIIINIITILWLTIYMNAPLSGTWFMGWLRMILYFIILIVCSFMRSLILTLMFICSRYIITNHLIIISILRSMLSIITLILIIFTVKYVVFILIFGFKALYECFSINNGVLLLIFVC